MLNVSEGSQALKPTRCSAGLIMTNEGVEEFVQPPDRLPHPILEDWCPSARNYVEMLACPKCKGDIRLNEKGDGLICDKCRLIYEIKDDIPIMLIDEAKPLK